jgi:hypothetical protein
MIEMQRIMLSLLRRVGLVRRGEVVRLVLRKGSRRDAFLLFKTCVREMGL